MKKKIIFGVTALAVVGGIAVAAAGFALNQESNTALFGEESVRSEVDYDAIHTAWTHRIDQVGAARAYAEFKREYETLSTDGTTSSEFGEQHAAAHIIGGLLYDADGLGGLAICDNSFAFGCYHGFFGTAVNAEGLGTISKLDAVCVETYGPYGTGCQHGIGHGIVEYLGHSEDALVEALRACEKTTRIQATTFGCTSGVFMEYNLPIIFSESGVRAEMRSFRSDNPYAPCNTVVPGQYKDSCYFELPQWWSVALAPDFERFGSMCEEIASTEHRKMCYLGFGYVVPDLGNYNVDRAITLCQELAKGNAEAELLCRASASWAFWAQPGHRESSLELCDGLNTEKMEERCVAESDLIGTGEKLESLDLNSS